MPSTTNVKLFCETPDHRKLECAVLLDGANCSVITNVTSTMGQLAYEKLSASSISTASNYAQQCYSANSTGLTDCNYFVSQRLPGFVDNSAPCPFKESLCRSNSTNLALDTGFISTDAHLGLNAPPEERLFIRHTLHCAPLVTEGHSSVHGNYTRYNYGSQWALIDPESDFSEGYLNYTYAVESLEDQYRVLDDATAIEQSYMLRPLFSGTVNGTPGADPNSGFVPGTELERTDADLFLVFLSGHGVFFSEPLYDDWYRATEPYASMREMQHEEIPIYRTSEAASPLACASQWQFCNTNTSACSPTASYHDAMLGSAQAFGINGDVAAESRSPATDRLGWLMESTGIRYSGEDSILLNLQDSALLSKQSLMQGYQGHLPDNQWQLDVVNWFSIYLALVQSNMLQTASGYQEAASGISAAQPMTEAAQRLCSNQKIRTTRYSSFSFFGILFTYIVGCMVILTSYSLEPLLACLHRRRSYKQYAYLEWMTNDTLQLYRVAHEGPNEVDGTWSRCTSWVPTTAPGVLLSSLDISDLKHPRLPAKDQESMTPSLDASEGDTAPPEAVGSGDSDSDPDSNGAQQPESTHEVVNADVVSPQISVSHVRGVVLNPNDERQVAHFPIPSQAVEAPSPLEETPCRHIPGSTLQTRPGQMSAFDHGRMPSPHSFPIIITGGEGSFAYGGGGAMCNFV
ncbi:hypothetical protein LA080_002498 [Diaporthe eres]|nr:hypothetical protein LA080_002498 [Diaporthe eres]